MEKLLSYQQKVLDLVNQTTNDGVEFYAQITNVLRIYYIGLNNIFIVKKILKNINFSSMKLSSQEITNLENAGWLLDDNYLDSVYLPAIKTNLILDAWLTFKGNNIQVTNNDRSFIEFFEVLIDSLYNNSMGKKNIDTKLNDEILRIIKDEKINFITMDVALDLVSRIIEIYSKTNEC